MSPDTRGEAVLQTNRGDTSVAEAEFCSFTEWAWPEVMCQTTQDYLMLELSQKFLKILGCCK